MTEIIFTCIVPKLQKKKHFFSINIFYSNKSTLKSRKNYTPTIIKNISSNLQKVIRSDVQNAVDVILNSHEKIYPIYKKWNKHECTFAVSSHSLSLT